MEGFEVSNFGSEYSAAYDAMYQDKDYRGECDQLEWGFQKFGTIPISSVLDIGCGTGKHSWELANRGFQVTGVDRSAEMLSVAKNQTLGETTSTKPRFEQGDATDFDLTEEFDAVIMMFAVISYLSTNESLMAGLKNIFQHLKPGGLFLADFWYGPGVLMDNPTQRSHKRSIGETTVERRVIPQLNLAENTCLLSYEVITLDSNQESYTMNEDHVMRYLFGPELELALSIAGLELLHLGQSSNWSLKLEDADWTGSLVARRV
jgi:SAM-dependent methyltransferase